MGPPPYYEKGEGKSALTKAKACSFSRKHFPPPSPVPINGDETSNRSPFPFPQSIPDHTHQTHKFLTHASPSVAERANQPTNQRYHLFNSPSFLLDFCVQRGWGGEKSSYGQCVLGRLLGDTLSLPSDDGRSRVGGGAENWRLSPTRSFGGPPGPAPIPRAPGGGREGEL